MTDVIKNKIAVNCNQKEIQQMAVGSDVESSVAGENSAITIQNLTNSAESHLLKEMPKVDEASNDNGEPTLPPTTPAGEMPLTSESEEDKVLSKEEIDKAVSEYKLQKMVALVPPAKYRRTRNMSVSASIKRLRYELALKPFLLAIPKRPGARPGKGIPSKGILVKKLYGLERYGCEQIESLEAEWVEKAIIYAKESKVPATATLSFRLKKEFEQKAKEVERMKKQEAKNQKFVKSIENSQKANITDTYNAAIVDLTQMPANCIPETLTLPLADNALVLVAVMPAKLLDAIDLIEKWGLTYVDNIVWNRDRIKGQYVWSKNIHTNILIATKGKPEEPIEYFRFNSDTFEHQEEDKKCLPDYYFSEVEQLIVGGKYLEVFTARQYNEQWFSYQAQGGKNV